MGRRLIFAVAAGALLLLSACGSRDGEIAASTVADRPVAATPSGGCESSAEPGERTLRIESDGGRTALVHVPGGLERGDPVPLVVGFHGAGQEAGVYARQSRLPELADRDRFVAVFPVGEGMVWDVSGERDLAFTAELLDQLDKELCIDPKRVFATGLSNGGGMTARVGCSLASRFAGIAPVAGAYGPQPDRCDGDLPPLLAIHSTGDEVVPYSSGVLDFVEGWARRADCRDNAPERAIDGASELRWQKCTAGGDVTHLRVEGGGHWIPGTSRSDPADAFDGPEAIQAFFQTIGG